MESYIKRHGIAIGIERVHERFFLSLKATGKLTHEDYNIIVPMIESAIAGVEAPEIDVLIDGTEMEGWEARAAWDDLKLGIKHGKAFKRIAIVGHKKWQEMAAKVGSWFVSGEVKYFENAQEAVDWLGVDEQTAR